MNSNKRMTIDELILWCKGEAMHHEDSHDHERASGYRRVMKFITDNRSRLEATKPPVLTPLIDLITKEMYPQGKGFTHNAVNLAVNGVCEKILNFIQAEFIEDTP